MNGNQARMFFLKAESYSNCSLPKYINIEKGIAEGLRLLPKRDSNLTTLMVSKNILKEKENINYTILVNKDGAYGWRPIQLIHPLLYIDLVNTITKENSWNALKEKFKTFQSDERIKCISIPVESNSRKNDTATSILNWWENFEQEQIKYALDYEYCIQTDITNCYPSIYTHTIQWALSGKKRAKELWAGKNTQNKSTLELLGENIDNKIQRMQMGQTNGIPQGSVLMDFVAELVLGYADSELSKALKASEFSNVKVLRFRDDYRIFANSQEIAERAIKILSNILTELNFKMNSKKTYLDKDIIIDAVKPDKIYWDMKFSAIFSRVNNEIIYHFGIQKHLFQIKLLGDKFPNCGSLKKALTEIYKNRIFELKTAPKNLEQLISITVNIMVNNPGTFEHCVAILGKLLTFVNEEQIDIVVNKILRKFESTPNTDLAEIWLQRLSLTVDRNKTYITKLCSKVSSPEEIRIWNSSWLKEGLFNEKGLIDEQIIKREFDETVLIDEQIISELSLVTPIEQLDLFDEISG